jgi:hypothetical protein
MRRGYRSAAAVNRAAAPALGVGRPCAHRVL